MRMRQICCQNMLWGDVLGQFGDELQVEVVVTVPWFGGIFDTNTRIERRLTCIIFDQVDLIRRKS